MKKRKFDRGTNQRKALFRNLANSLILHEQIVTTEPKAKSIRPILEKLITKAKRGDLLARRQVAGALGNPNATSKMFDLVGPRFKNRPGGYLRITKLSPRAGDSAKMAKIEFVEEVSVPEKKTKQTKTAEPRKETVLEATSENTKPVKKLRKVKNEKGKSSKESK